MSNKLIKGVCMLVTQLHPTLCDPIDCTRPDSSVHGILQARILECQRTREIEFRSWRQNHQSKPLDQWSVTRPSPLGFAEEVFPQRWKVVKQVKYLLGGNRVQYMWIDRWADPEKESPWVAPSCSLYYFYGAFLPGFLWSVILVCLVHGPYLVHLGALPHVHTHPSAKRDSTKEAYG